MVCVRSYVNVHCFVVCFSVVDSITYKNIKERWIPELKVQRPGAPCHVVCRVVSCVASS